MRHLILSLTMSAALALVGLALVRSGRPYIAAIFFIAAALGTAADMMTVRKALRARRSPRR